MGEHMDGINKKRTNETTITTNKEIQTSKLKYIVQGLIVMEEPHQYRQLKAKCYSVG